MDRFNLIWLGVLTIILTACGTGENKISVPVSKKLNIDAGDDKRIVINESVTIKGSVQKTDTEIVSYEWREKEETLATTETFTYTPTTLGTYTLSFIVESSDGTSIEDKMRVVVTSKEVNLSIPAILETDKSDYLNAVNTARSIEQDCGSRGVFTGTTAVVWNKKLYYSAYEHAQDLISSQTFTHEGSGTESDWSGYALGKKSSQVERVENYGYEWSHLGENLGGGAPVDTAKKVVQAWLESDSHCENLMNPNFTEMGMVMLEEENSLYTNYWGQNFGTQKERLSIK